MTATALDAALRRDIQDAPQTKGPDRRKQARDSSDRRGPLRPEQLTPSRARLNGRILSMSFRAGDLILVVAVALTVLGIRSPAVIAQATIATAMPHVAALALLITGLTFANAYAFKPREELSSHLIRLAAAFGLAVSLVAVLVAPFAGFAIFSQELLPWIIVSFAAVTIAHMGAWHWIRSLRRAGKLTQNIVVVGGGKNAERMIEAAFASGDVAVIGIFDDRADRGPKQIRGVPVLGDTASMIDHKVMPFVDKVVIAVPSSAQDRIRALLDRLKVLPNPVTLFVDIEGELTGGSIARVADAPLAYLSGKPNDEMRAILKRAQDLVISSVALIFALPLMAGIAVAIKLDSPGPVFFRQRRHGFNNEVIVVWKFRSMRFEASDATASRQIQANDDRVTKVGKVIRRLSLDEVPQIFNVLSGEMSLVGPRPHAIGMMTGDVESAKLVAEYAHRHRMKPGVTGWAAIKGSRGAVDTPAAVRRRIALDVEYVERQSFWLDLYIMALTIPCLLGDDETIR